MTFFNPDINPPNAGTSLLNSIKPVLNPTNSIPTDTAVSANGILVNNSNAILIGVNIAPIKVNNLLPTLVMKFVAICQILSKLPLTVPNIVFNFVPKSQAFAIDSLYFATSDVSIFMIWLACLYPAKSL